MINMLFVKKDFRRQGFGEILLTWYVKHLFLKTSNLYLFYSSDNISAQRLYEKMGFKKIGTCVMAVKFE